MVNKFLVIVLLVSLFSCKSKKEEKVKQTRTSGNVTMLVDESVGPIIQKQIDIFKVDYPDANFKNINRPEEKLLPAFLNDSVRVAVLARLLTPEEEEYYKKRKIRINASRIAIDGIALITNIDNIDSTINVSDVIDVLQGKKSDKKLIFDNAYSSTFRYFRQLAKINQFPKEGVYAKSNSNEVIDFIAKEKNYIGVVGVNWLSHQNVKMAKQLEKVKMLGVKNIKGQIGDDQYYKPTQYNLINGLYPFLRNINYYDCEGRDGLGTGFATWLRSQRGQLIVLKSGLGPHKLMPREINLKSK